MKILVVEDEPEMMSAIVSALEDEHYLVETASNYLKAIQKLNDYDYDCVLLDITLQSKASGLDLLKELKQMNKSEGVIIISAKNSLEDKLAGLDLGADDYLAKPFHLPELLARVKSVNRRRKFLGSNQIRSGNLVIEPDSRLVSVDGRAFETNRKEFDVLLYLVSNENRLVQKAALAEHVWGDHVDAADNFEFIYSQIKNLRKKLRDSNASVDIQAVYGMGYKLVAE